MFGVSFLSFLSILDPKKELNGTGNKGCLLVQGHCAMLSFFKVF